MSKFNYRNKRWVEYRERVKKRDGYKCLKCHDVRNLQVHHTYYEQGKKIWEYPISACITLCKKCHAIEHKKIPPKSEWTLVEIYDLGEPTGTCEKEGCGHEIRYEHHIYHPDWGYKIVGSSCVEWLTNEDVALSKSIIIILKQISDLLKKSIWKESFTKKGVKYIFYKTKSNEVRIYGDNKKYSIQTVIKRQYSGYTNYSGLDLDKVKELAVIILKGMTSIKEEEKEILRNILTSIQIK